MRHLAAAAAAIALLAVAAGCGGGGGSTSSDSVGGGGDAAATANEACAEANRKIASLGTPDNQQAVLEYLEATGETVAKLQVEVAAAAGGPADYRRYSQALATAVGVLDEMANAARSGNPDAVRELAKALERLHVGRLAEAAGLEACAEAPGVES